MKTNGLSNSKSFWRHKKYLDWISTKLYAHSLAPVCFCGLFSKPTLPIPVNSLFKWLSSGNRDKMFKEYLWKNSLLNEVKSFLPAAFDKMHPFAGVFRGFSKDFRQIYGFQLFNFLTVNFSKRGQTECFLTSKLSLVRKI